VRGTVDGLGTPRPLGLGLPGIYHEDEFAQRLAAALDVVLAPVLSALDNLPSYLDPAIAPLDFVEFLAGWVGVELDETWPEARQRQLVAEAVRLYRWRGTARGLREVVLLYTGVEPEIEDSGGVAWSPAPGGALPGAAEPSLVVRVRVPDVTMVNPARLEALVRAATPAHVPHRVEVVPT